MTQTLYLYCARTVDGSAIQGSMLADSGDAVVAALRARALFVTAVSDGRSAVGYVRRLSRLRGASHGAVVSFFRAFATLVRAGVSLQRSLAVAVAQCADRRLRETLSAMAASIESGSSIAGAMRKHPDVFGSLHIAIVAAGEAGGILDDVLERLATLLERDRALRGKVTAALIYPGVVLSAALAVVTFLAATVVPTFLGMFAELGVPLPLPTRILLGFASIVRNPVAWPVAALATVATLLGGRELYRLGEVAIKIDRWRFRIPVFGQLRRTTVVARIARIWGSLLRSGVDVLASIDVVIDIAGSAVYAEALREIQAALRVGDTIGERLSRSGAFEPFFVQMVAVGEETGALDRMLQRIADAYEAEVELAIASLSSVLEPLLIAIVGTVVGFIVLSIFLPLYGAIGAIR